MKKQQNKINIKKKLIILEKTKTIVKNYGWSEKILNKLIKQGVSKSDLVYFFNNNYKEIINFSLENLNSILEDKINKINIINFPINKRIKLILINRMTIINKDKIFYKKTFYHLLIPQNVKIMKKNLYKSVDSMWYLAGDNSVDFNFYTKRITLAIIYTNALFVLFNKDFQEAEVNIDKNLNRISNIPKLKNRFSFIKDNLPIILKGLFN